MMVWFGSHWAFWQSGLMSIADSGLLAAGGLGDLRLYYRGSAEDAQP